MPIVFLNCGLCPYMALQCPCVAYHDIVYCRYVVLWPYIAYYRGHRLTFCTFRKYKCFWKTRKPVQFFPVIHLVLSRPFSSCFYCHFTAHKKKSLESRQLLNINAETSWVLYPIKDAFEVCQQKRSHFFGYNIKVSCFYSQPFPTASLCCTALLENRTYFASFRAIF